MNPKIKTKIRFKVKGIVVAECSNIVTNVGLSSIASGGFPSNIAVGTGSQKEEASVTVLNRYKRQEKGTWYQEAKNKIDVETNTITNIGTLKVSFPVESENTIYTEVGIANADKNLYTYALLRDSLGEISSVTVLKGERLEVEYTVSFSYPYAHQGEGSTLYLLGMPRIQDIPVNMDGGHHVGVYTGSNDALVGGTAPTGNNHVKDAFWRKRADKLITGIPAFVNRPQIEVNGLYVYPAYANDDYRRYTYCIAFDSPKKLPPEFTYECEAILPYFLNKE